MEFRARRLYLAVGDWLCDGSDDVLLYVSADVPQLSREAAHVARGGTSHSRVAQVDDGTAGHFSCHGLTLRVSRLPAESGAIGWNSWGDEQVRSVPGAG